MSVFRGSISEYPGVIIDHFIPSNCFRGRAFFLSHCHKDHMTGLSSPQTAEAVKKRNTNLFCSEVTRSLLLQDPEFTQLAPFLRGLPLDEPVSMSFEALPDSPALNFTVTLLPAGHCPGSTMFFFQGTNGGVLYTGDFRLTLEETQRLRPLHCGGKLLDIRALYLDTTFCHPIASSIPSRDVSRDIILRIADSWLAKDPHNVLYLQCNMFGYEHIFMAMAKKFNTKIHIARWRMNAYQGIPAVASCLTTDGESTRIHCCRRKKGPSIHCGLPCGSCCQNGRRPQLLSIKPSTLWFLSKSGSLNKPYIYVPEYNIYRVIHSMHASYKEVCDFIGYLKPKRIVPCVVPLGDRTLTDVTARLKTLLPQVNFIATEETEEYVPAPLTETETKTTEKCTLASLTESKTENETGGVLSKHTPVVVHDSSSDVNSDDTIDEFVSSEECRSQALNRSFSSRPPNETAFKPFTLPSMLTGHASESTTLLHSKSVRTQTSSGSSESATVGSLEQTPIDLSPENTPTTTSVSISSSVVTGQNSCIDGSNKAAVESISVCFGENTSEAGHNIHSESAYKCTLKKPTFSRSKHSSLRHSLQTENRYLCLESSDEEQTMSSTDQAISFTDQTLASTGLPFSSDETNVHSCIKADSTSDDNSDGNSGCNSDCNSGCNSDCNSDGSGLVTPKPKRAKLHRYGSHSSYLSSEVECETDPSISTSVTTSDDCKEVGHGSILSVPEITEPTGTVYYIDLTQDDDDECLSDESHATGLGNTELVNVIRTKSITLFDNRDIIPCNRHQAPLVLVTKETLSQAKKTPTISPVEPDIIIIDEEEPAGICSTRDPVTVGNLETAEGYSPTRSYEQESPLYLPPTPGRERVDSILDRKNIAF